MNLFQRGNFTLHSGATRDWKIECDALSIGDWDCIARMLSRLLSPFSTAIGIPRGGIPLARALERYASFGKPLLVDDVLTTGASLEKGLHLYPGANGAVVFACGPVPTWVTPLFRMSV